MIQKKRRTRRKYLTVDTEDDWHEALRRGRWVETPVQLAEQIGVPMDEDVGTLADNIAACADRWHWPLFLSLWGKSGTSYARRVSDDLIEQIKQGVAPWQKPWKPGERVAPENFSTGKRYTAGPGHPARVWRHSASEADADLGFMARLFDIPTFQRLSAKSATVYVELRGTMRNTKTRNRTRDVPSQEGHLDWSRPALIISHVFAILFSRQGGAKWC